MLFTHLVLNNLRHRFTRTVLTVVGLAIAVAAITIIWTISLGYATSATNFYDSRGTDIVVVRAGVSNRLTSNLHGDIADRIRALPNIRSVDGSLTEMVSLGSENLLGIPLRGFLPEGSTLRDLTIREGTGLRENSTAEVLLASGLADSLGKKPGQRIDIEGTPFKILGIFEAENPFDANSLIGSLSDVQGLMGRPEIVSEFQVQVARDAQSAAAVQRVCREIESLQDDKQEPLGLRAQRTRDFVDSASEARLSGAVSWATTAIVLALSFIGVLNAMLMSILERTRELGVLRAIGWKPWRITCMVLSESAAIALFASFIGILTSCIMLAAMHRTPAISLLVPNSISLQAAGFAILTALAGAIVGSFYPSFRAANVPPVESLRYE